MGNPFKRIACALVALLVLATGWAFAEAGPATPVRDIVVLFTSDVHCGIDQGFGYVGLKAIRDALEREGNAVLLVDDGDAIQGEAIGILTQGQAIIGLMNQMGYDVAIPGNHEFDYGAQRFIALADAAEFPYVSCNFNRNGELVFPPYVIREAGGVKLAFVGITTPESLTSSNPRFFQDDEGNFIYGFMRSEDGAEAYAAVQKAADDARAEGAKYVILLAHLGNSGKSRPYTYADVIGHTRGIDAVLDGHSHDTDKVAVKNAEGRAVPRQACGTKLEGIGWLRIAAADGSVETWLYTWNNAVPAPRLLGLQNDMSDTVDDMMAWVDEQLDFVVAQCACELTINDPIARDDAGKPVRIIRRAETNLGDLIADAFRARSGAVVGVACAGGIRMGLPKGQKRPVHGRGGRVPGQARHNLGRTVGDGQDLHPGVPGFYTDKPRRRPDRLRWSEDDLAGRRAGLRRGGRISPRRPGRHCGRGLCQPLWPGAHRGRRVSSAIDGGKTNHGIVWICL